MAKSVKKSLFIEIQNRLIPIADIKCIDKRDEADQFIEFDGSNRIYKKISANDIVVVYKKDEPNIFNDGEIFSFKTKKARDLAFAKLNR